MDEQQISRTDSRQNERLATLDLRVGKLETQMSETSKIVSETAGAVSALREVTALQGKWMLRINVGIFLAIVGAAIALVVRG